MSAIITISDYKRPGLRRYWYIFAVSACIWGLSFASMAQADVNTEDIISILIQGVPAPPGSVDFANDVAVKQVLQRLVRKPDGSFDDDFARRLGFDFFPQGQSEAAVQQASTLPPIATFLIGLKRLQQYNAGAEPLKLLAADSNWLTLSAPLRSIVAPSHFLFPIAVTANASKVVQSTVRLRTHFSPIASTPPNLAYDIKSFGYAPLIRLVDKWRRDPNTTGPIVPQYFLVWVPALDRYYLGRLLNKDLLIKAIADDPQVGLKAGQEDVAKEVFLKLKGEAVTINADDQDAPPR